MENPRSGSGHDGEPLNRPSTGEATLHPSMEDILDRLQQGVCGLSAAWRAGHMHEFEQFLRVLSETWGHRLAHDGYAFADLADTIAELDEMLLDEQARAAALAEKFESFIQLCRRAVLRD